MTFNKLFTSALLVWLAFGGAGAQGADPITIESLLNEMVDRAALARFPSPHFTCRQASSYDRDAESPEKQDTWYANWDRSQFIRTDDVNGRKEYVLFDADGPGAVVRIWATWHGPGGGPFSNGTIRIYFDGSDQPEIEGPMSEVLDQGRLTGPPLSEGVSPETEYAKRGHNLYLPIPYSKHCKITYSTDVEVDRGAKKGEALYYQINYRTYDQGTPVTTFSLKQLDAARSLVDRVNQQLASGQIETGDDWKATEFGGEVAPGGSSQPIRIQGPGAIRSLACRLQADDPDQALRSTVLEIKFDGERTIWCPLGDFYGTGYKLRPYRTWFTRVDDNGLMTSAWVMPFQRDAEITIHNVGAQPVRVADAKIQHSGWDWDDRSMLFHATWRQLTEVDTGGKKEMDGHTAFDVNYTTVEGQGVYVGDTLTLCSGASEWWGEGDEKIFVDGEKFPSHFGTGTEDYYGYAWCRPESFSSAFHAQPEGGGNLVGGFSVNSRYRALDVIPFSKSLKFDMELWHWADTKINYAPSTFWYARPGATCSVAPDPESAAKPVAKERTDLVPIHHIDGAIEGETLKVVELTGGRHEVQNGGFGWSGDAQLWWIDGHTGDKLVLEFPVEKAGNYKLLANLTKAPDYGIVEFRVNDQPSKKFDRFHKITVEHDLLDLGTFSLQQGANRLAVEIVGENPEAVPKRMFGLDYLKLE
jgi:hypothetical protein